MTVQTPIVRATAQDDRLARTTALAIIVATCLVAVVGPFLIA